MHLISSSSKSAKSWYVLLSFNPTSVLMPITNIINKKAEIENGKIKTMLELNHPETLEKRLKSPQGFSYDMKT